jgi:hypothetical protein
MNFLLFMLVLLAVISVWQQLRMISALKSRHLQAWRKWGSPYPISATPKGSLAFVAFVLSSRVKELGDRDVMRRVVAIRVVWAAFMVVFIIAVVSFLAAFQFSQEST